jgi:copper(I)-binding protein
MPVKSTVLMRLAVSLAALGLAGCQQEAGEPAAQPSEAAPEAPAGISVTNGRLTLPAVAGNPGAVYFDVTNNGAADTAIAGAAVDGAEHAMLHTTSEQGGMTSMAEMTSVPLPKGATVSFSPGGNHVMAMGLSDTLKAGEEVDVTVTFANGDKASFEADVRAPGDAD